MQVAIVSAGTRQKFCIPLGFHGFAAPRAIVLHALRTFMPTHVLELFKNMCGHTCSQGVENKCLRRCKTMGPSVSRTCRNNRNSCYFSPGDQNFADQTAPVLGSRNGPQNGGHSFSLNLICLCPDDLAPVSGSVSGPQNGCRFVGKIFCRRAKNSASCDCFRRYATEVLHTAGLPWFRSAASNCSPRPANVYAHTCS